MAARHPSVLPKPSLADAAFEPTDEQLESMARRGWALAEEQLAEGDETLRRRLQEETHRLRRPDPTGIPSGLYPAQRRP